MRVATFSWYLAEGATVSPGGAARADRSALSPTTSVMARVGASAERFMIPPIRQRPSTPRNGLNPLQMAF